MNAYLLFKSTHLIAVISWMAGLLYLPRIFVYHSEAVEKNKSEDLTSTFKSWKKGFLFIL
jgi:putative membrane protein